MADSGKSPTARSPMVGAEMVLAWLAEPGNDKRDHHDRLKTFAEFIASDSVAATKPDVLVRYHQQLAGQGYAVKTIADRVRLARRVLRWAKQNGWTDIEPEMPKLKKAMRKARDVEPGKLATLLGRLPSRAGAVVRFILYTGCRPGEALAMDWRDVRLSHGEAVVHEHKTGDKTGQPRTVYLTAQARAILEALPDRQGPVFKSRLGKPYAVMGLRAILKKHTGITPYQLRHSFAQMASDQIDEVELSKLMGHRSATTTRFYYEVRSQRAREAAARLTFPEPAAPDAGVRPATAGKSKCRRRA
ncbi:MAG: site-specific integrase [Planctomycetes bacterium]|nr:site-specific integrase [Planctomycetota bacterium]